MKGVARPLLALQQMNMLHESTTGSTLAAMASLQSRFQSPAGMCLDLSFRDNGKSLPSFSQTPNHNHNHHHHQPVHRDSNDDGDLDEEDDEDETIDVECLSPASDSLGSPTGGFRYNGDNSPGAQDALNLSSPDSDGSEKDGREGGKKLSGGDKKLYSCQHCKYVTDRKNNLKRHVVTMHEKCNKMLECCDMVFANKAALRDHVLSCHRNGYDCRICGRNFCRKALLKRHITVHSGQKDYVCGVCGYATSHKSNLDRHKRRHGPKIPGLTLADDKSHHGRAPKSAAALQAQMDHFNRAFFSYIVPNDFYTQPYGEDAQPYRFHNQNRTGPGGRNRFPVHGRYMFTKRLLCTYESLLNNNTKDQLVRQAGEEDEEELFCDHNPQNHCPSEDRFALSSPSPHTPLLQKDKLYPQPLVKRLLHRTRSPASTKRLFPTLYRCKSCDVVFDKQLQLTEHYDVRHSDKNCPRVPQRPLTLQARSRERDRGWHVSG